MNLGIVESLPSVINEAEVECQSNPEAQSLTLCCAYDVVRWSRVQFAELGFQRREGWFPGGFALLKLKNQLSCLGYKSYFTFVIRCTKRTYRMILAALERHSLR